MTPAQNYLPTIKEGKVLRVELADAPGSATEGTAVRLAASQPGDNTPGYSTNGWDTVFVIRVPDVNTAIAAKAVSPKTWSAKVPASLFGPEIDANGTFGTWSVTLGGSGSILYMAIPFTADLTTQNVQVTGGAVHIAVKLDFIPQPATSNGTPNALVLRSRGDGDTDPAVTVTSVSYTSPVYTDPDEKKALDNALKEVLGQWFNANLAAFSYVFATVNLGILEASGAFQWLFPTYTTYAYVDSGTMEDALLGVLCMTEQRDPSGAVQEISPGSLPDGARASFNISQERFLQKMVLPSLPVEFSKAGKGTFAVTNNDTQVSASRSFSLDSVSVAGVDYTPEVDTFQITLVGSTLQTYAYIHTPISPGIDAYSQVTYYTTLVLGTKADGTQSLTFKETRSADRKSWYTVADWVQGVEIAADVILAIASAVIGGVAAKIEKVIIRVIVALIIGGVVSAVAAVLEKIPEWIADSVPDALPDIDALVSNATASTTWTDATDFKISNVLLNGGLQLGGDPFGE
jgi:hypothetical protein